MKEQYQIRCYTSYSGVSLPLNLVCEISEQDLRNRNIYFQGCYDKDNRLSICLKIVYGETEFEHRYSYYEDGRLKQALISEEENELTTLNFDGSG
ncbi:DUF6156 family protein [Methylomarinum vadi]|uniref:DUF6156 family protein n=1 Tax=Methylomarinum vadi TaxID=438855 RepID=UPI0004DF3EA4|nr:DUF6156 family protein [Methylomarinum vadi]